MDRTILCAALSLACVAWPAAAQEQRDTATKSVMPGPDYRASWPHRLLFGGQWRDVWTTPLRVPVLDLETFDGGLTPARRGGGLQTKNLHLKSGNGRSWLFRSVDKDPTRSLDPAMRESMAAEVLRDLTSAAYPVAELVVAPLLEAVDVLHTTPQLVWMPDDPRLGSHRGDFAGVLGIIAERPARGFAGSDKMMHTYQLFARLDGRSDEQVDVRAYLRARLVDLLVGDWDRHVDQWRWLRFEESGHRVWRPVPRDRDQAFSRFDGILPTIAEYYTKQLASFDDDYPAIDKLTFAAWHLDHRFLVPLGRDEWRAVTADVVARLTDRTIADAVRHLPPELYARDGARIEKALRSRRDRLSAASEAFYLLLFHEVDVYGTEGAERVSIRPAPAGGVEVTLSACNGETGEAVSAPFFHRIFYEDETSEIRLYLLGGADRIVDEGEGAIKVRIVRGHPPEEGPRRQQAIARGTRASDEATQAADEEAEALRQRYERFRDWGADWLVFPQLSYDGTLGFVAGARVQRTGYGFERKPYADTMNLAGAWATGVGEPRLEYSIDVRTRSPVEVMGYVAYSGMDLPNFYGLGNETTRNSTLQARDYYRVYQRHFVARSFVATTLGGPVRGRAGATLDYFDNHSDRPTAATGLYGWGTMMLASAELGVGADTRAGSGMSRRGLMTDLSLRYYPPWLDNKDGFWKLRGEASARLGAEFRAPALLVVRVAGEKNWNRYPFSEAAFIGGPVLTSIDPAGPAGSGNMLRGFDWNRFAGDASLVTNADLRIPIGSEYATVLPLRFGLLGLADFGRVFLSSESSSQWHWGAGGGFWMSWRATGFGAEIVSSMSLALVRSDEGTSVYLLSAFGF